MDFFIILVTLLVIFFAGFAAGSVLSDSKKSDSTEQHTSIDDDDAEDNRFIEICDDVIDQFLSVSVLVDRDTGVAYLCYRAGQQSVCSTVLVDANGKPYIYYEHKRG